MLIGVSQGTANADAVVAKNIEDTSLEELLATEVGVAATPMATRDIHAPAKPSERVRSTPGIVYVLRREELVASGARDLVDALQLVPGITVHADVSGAVSIALRGLWAQEGKVLMMIDGKELNETLYDGVALRDHYPVELIERIEVIRGPGSASYGGTAELGVINIITRTGGSLRGTVVTTRYGQHGTEPMDLGLVVAAGDVSDDDKVEGSVQVALGNTRRTDRSYTDFAGTTISLRRVTPEQPTLVVAKLRYNNLHASFLYDDYVTGSKTGLGLVTADDEVARFRMMLASVDSDVRLTDSLVLRPRFDERVYVPWQSPLASESQHYNKSATRTLGGLTLLAHVSDTLALVAGLEGYWDHAWLNDDHITNLQTLFGTSTSVDYANLAVHTEAQWDAPHALNLTGGLRFEYHSQYGPNLAARAAATRVSGPLSLKLLYANAFRSPSIENINLGINVQSERAQVAEAEAGVKFGSSLYVSANGFYTAIDRPLQYSFDPTTNTEAYVNQGNLATAGVEAVAIWRVSGGFVNANYSLAVPTSESTVYEVPGQTHRLLGMPLHKGTISGMWRVAGDLRLGGNLVLLSDRYGFLTPSEALDGTGTLGRISPSAMATVWVDYLMTDGLTARLGLSNVFDSNVLDVQPYNGGAAPIPGARREVFIQLTWNPDLFGRRRTVKPTPKPTPDLVPMPAPVELSEPPNDTQP